MNDKTEELVHKCVALCSQFKSSIDDALRDLSWSNNGLGLTEEQEFSVRQRVKTELRKLRQWGVI